MGNKQSETKKNKLTPDDSERQALTKQIEGDLPYDRALYINEVRYLMKHTAETIIEIGKRLLIIQEKEGKGSFIRLVEEEINIPYRTAFRFMNVAIKAEKYPSIELAKLASCSKVYALLEAPEEELKRFEQLGLFAGKDADDLERMSVKELRDLVRQTKKSVDLRIEKEVKKQVEENKALQREVDGLRRRHPDDLGTWVTGMRPDIAQAWEEFLAHWKFFVMNDNSVNNDEAQDYMIEFYDRIFADLDSIDETRYGKTGQRYTRKKK